MSYEDISQGRPTEYRVLFNLLAKNIVTNNHKNVVIIMEIECIKKFDEVVPGPLPSSGISCDSIIIIVVLLWYTLTPAYLRTLNPIYMHIRDTQYTHIRDTQMGTEIRFTWPLVK